MSLDLKWVRRAFGRAASSYEAAAVLQHQVESMLLDRLDSLTRGAAEGTPAKANALVQGPLYKNAPGRILDLGCGTGRAAAFMRKRYAQCDVIALDMALPMLREAKRHAGWWKPFRRICGDARALPLQDQSVDVLFSNLCLQWIENLPEVFAEFRRVLRPGGWLLFSTFGPDTLTELRQSWAAADQCAHVNVFLDMHDVGDAMLAAGFRDPMLDVERFTLTYRDARQLMRELKAIGASNANAARTRGLTGKSRLHDMLEYYERFRSAEGLLPASYEVIFAQAQAPELTQPRRTGDGEIASISVDALRAQLRKK
ncbi:MAG: malonyl-ACP O-methyltransferase BioC [Pseudomonadota bacterium]|nr:malonyl-ACP O-methyltransferase BioC [Pseudomonadota bacterium]